MIPVNVPLSEVQHFNDLWYWVGEVFATLGPRVFQQTWLAYFAALILLIGGARFVWRFVKGVM